MNLKEGIRDNVHSLYTIAEKFRDSHVLMDKAAALILSQIPASTLQGNFGILSLQVLENMQQYHEESRDRDPYNLMESHSSSEINLSILLAASKVSDWQSLLDTIIPNYSDCKLYSVFSDNVESLPEISTISLPLHSLTSNAFLLPLRLSDIGDVSHRFQCIASDLGIQWEVYSLGQQSRDIGDFITANGSSGLPKVSLLLIDRDLDLVTPLERDDSLLSLAQFSPNCQLHLSDNFGISISDKLLHSIRLGTRHLLGFVVEVLQMDLERYSSCREALIDALEGLRSSPELFVENCELADILETICSVLERNDTDNNLMRVLELQKNLFSEGKEGLSEELVAEEHRESFKEYTYALESQDMPSVVSQAVNSIVYDNSQLKGLYRHSGLISKVVGKSFNGLKRKLQKGIEDTVVVFMVGGVSWNEIRVVHETIREGQGGGDIFIGGSSLL